MAQYEIIDQLVSKAALEGLEKLNKDLATSYEAMEKLLARVQSLTEEYTRYGKSLSDISKFAAELNKVIREKETLEKQELNLLQEKEKLVRQTLKTERENQKTEQEKLKTDAQSQKVAQEKLKTDAQEEKVTREKIKTKKEEIGLAERQEKANKKAEDAMRSQEGSINKMRQVMAALVVEYNRADGAARERLAPAIRELQERINEANAAIGRSQGYVGQYGRALSGLAGVFKELIGAMGIVAGLSMFINILKDAYSEIVGFEQANANLAVTLGKSAKQITPLTESAKRLGSTTEWAASQVTELQTELAKLGFNEGQIKNMQASVLRFATAVGANLADAAEFAGESLRQFGLQSSETERVLSVVAVGVDRSALSFEYLETAMSTVAPIAKSFGFTIEDTVALLGALSNAGFDAGSAATATKNILLNLADANGKLAKELGKPIRTVPELAAALKELRARGANLADTLELTDKVSVAAFNAFIDGADALVELRGQMEDTEEELKRMQEERLKTVEGSVTLLKSAWKGLMLSFYESRGAMKTVVDGLTGIVNIISTFLKTARQIGDDHIAGKIAEAEDNRGKSAEDEIRQVELEAQAYINAGMSENEALERVKKERFAIWEEQEKKFKEQIKMAEDEREKVEKIISESGPLDYALPWVDTDKYTSKRHAEKEVVQWGVVLGDIKAQLVDLQARKDALFVAEEAAPPAGLGLGDKKAEEEAKRERERKAKELAEHIESLGLIEALRLNKSAETNREIAEDDRKTYDARREAAMAAAADEISAINKQRDAETDAVNERLKAQVISEQTAADQRLLITEKAAYDVIGIENRRDKEIRELNAEETEKRLKDVRYEIERKGRMLDEAAQNELVIAAKMYEEQMKLNVGNEERRKKLTDEYQKRKLDIVRKYNQEAFDFEVAQLEAVLAYTELSEEKKEEIRREMEEIRMKNGEELAEYEIKQTEDRAKKQLSLEEELNKILDDKRTKAVQAVWGMMLETMNMYYDSELARIDELEKREQEYWDGKLEMIEKNVEAGLMSEETADARRRIIEADQAQREKEYERKRKEMQKKQAVWQKAEAIVQATINTAQAITAALTIPVAGIALAAIVGALGAAQIAMIVSQRVPSYAKGTKEHHPHPGGFARLGDGGRPEMVILPSGEVWKTPATDTFACLPKGTEVLPDFRAAVERFSCPVCYDDNRGGMMIASDEVLRRNTGEMKTRLEAINRSLNAIRANSVYSQRKANVAYRLNRMSRRGL